jgi:hypothetical protein
MENPSQMHTSPTAATYPITVLDPITYSVFIHVTVNDQRGFEFGSLLKSNSNGTNHILSLDAVNRNSDGFVNFEKMQSLE